MTRTRALVYTRISKDDKKDQLGVDRQERLCRDLGDRRDFDIVRVFCDDDRSAWNRAVVRDDFEAMLDALKGGEADALLVYHVDRLARRHGDLERMEEIAEIVGFMTYTVASGDVDLSTAAGQMQAEMLVSFAKGESKRISERTKLKHDELARRGRAPGGRPPYGYRWHKAIAADGRVETAYQIDDVEADALRTMARRVLEGGSLLKISRELDAAGVTTREGRPWHHSTVRSVLLNPAVAGLRVHRRQVAGPGTWQPILDRSLWEQVRAVLADPARKRERPATKHLLSGFVFNPAGERMNGSVDKQGRAIYTTRQPATQSLQVDAAGLDDLIVEAVLTLTDRSSLPAAEAVEPDADDVIGRLEAELAELAELRGCGDITLAEWMAARKPLQERIEAAKQAAGSKARPVSRDVRLLDEPGAVRRAWPTLDLAARREVLSAVVERVEVGPATRGRWTQLVDRVDIRWRA